MEEHLPDASELFGGFPILLVGMSEPLEDSDQKFVFVLPL
jgi:chloramphenicol 3-O-phosphotransferase